MTAFVGFRGGHEGAAVGDGRRASPAHAVRDGARRVRHERLQPGLGEGAGRPDGTDRRASAPLGPPPPGRRGALRRGAVRGRTRRAPPLHERDHDGARGFHARLVRLRVHPDEDALAGLHHRRSDPRRAAAARRVHGRGRRAVGLPGLALFAILFVWQLPHFFAIGWRHRVDYAKAGVVILPVVDPTGRSTARQTLLWTAVLLPISLLPSLVGTAGFAYALGAFAMTLLFLTSSFRFARDVSDSRALSLFLASIGWLPADPRPPRPRPRLTRSEPAAARDATRRRNPLALPLFRGARSRFTTSRCRSRAARSSPSSARTAAARRRSSASSRPCCLRRGAALDRRARSPASATRTHPARGSASSSSRRASTGSSPSRRTSCIRARSTACPGAIARERASASCSSVSTSPTARRSRRDALGRPRAPRRDREGAPPRPPVLLLDEPSTGLDPGARRDLVRAPRELAPRGHDASS